MSTLNDVMTEYATLTEHFSARNDFEEWKKWTENIDVSTTTTTSPSTNITTSPSTTTTNRNQFASWLCLISCSIVPLWAGLLLFYFSVGIFFLKSIFVIL